MIITFSGLPGAGKSSVSKLVANKLNYPIYNAGDEVRVFAKKHNIELTEFLHHTDLVKALDKKVKTLGKKKNYVIDSRLSAYFLPKAEFRIYLKAPLKVRARRIHDRQKIGLIKALKKTKVRQREEVNKYKKLYKVDYRNPKLYNIVFNTKGYSAVQTANELVKRIKGEK